MLRGTNLHMGLIFFKKNVENKGDMLTKFLKMSPNKMLLFQKFLPDFLLCKFKNSLPDLVLPVHVPFMFTFWNLTRALVM
jgi:hypothetical protein